MGTFGSSISRVVGTRRYKTEPISSRNCDHLLRDLIATASPRIRRWGGRPPARAAFALWILNATHHRPRVSTLRRLALPRMHATISGLSFVCRTSNYPQRTRSQFHNGRKTIMITRQPRPVASFAARSNRWKSNAARSEANSSQNAQRNYERYLALARAEAQIGKTIGAENYYQYAEHYFRSMRSDSEGT